MQPSMETRGGVAGKDSVNRSHRVVEKLSGEACGYCGARQYHLVFRVIRGRGAVLAARCSRCHEQRDAFSLEQLTRDMERAPVDRRYGCTAG